MGESNMVCEYKVRVSPTGSDDGGCVLEPCGPQSRFRTPTLADVTTFASVCPRTRIQYSVVKTYRRLQSSPRSPVVPVTLLLLGHGVIDGTVDLEMPFVQLSSLVTLVQRHQPLSKRHTIRQELCKATDNSMCSGHNALDNWRTRKLSF